MKRFCNTASLVFLLALFANAQEAPLPLSTDSTLVVVPQENYTPAPAPVYAPASPMPIYVPAPLQVVSLQKASPPPENPQDYQKNLRVVAYLHPIPLFFGAANDFFMFNATIEVPLNLSNAFIIQPAVWLGTSDGFFDNINVFSVLADEVGEVEYKKLNRFGTSIGMRHYVLNRASGFYLQAVAGAYYFSADSITYREPDYDDYDYGYYSSSSEVTTWTKVKGMVAEFMLYTGMAHKWQNISLSYEIGLGFGFDGTDTHQLGYINSLATSFNICLGIPF